jgi:large subunit ribosomal protein L11
MAKEIKGFVKLQLPAGGATPAPPVGTSLGAHGVNLMQFCQAFNAATESKKGTIIPVEITIYEDTSFDFVLKTPPAAVLIKEKLGIESGAGIPQLQTVGTLTDEQLTEIAEIKMPDLNANDIDAAKEIVAGTARSMGVRIEGRDMKIKYPVTRKLAALLKGEDVGESAS